MGLGRRGGQGLGERLQLAAAAGLDLGDPGRQAGEEPLHPLLHGGIGPEAGVGGDSSRAQAPIARLRVAGGAGGGQADQAQVEAGRRQVLPHCLAAVRRTVVPVTISGPGWLARNWRRKVAAVASGTPPWRLPAVATAAGPSPIPPHPVSASLTRGARARR